MDNNTIFNFHPELDVPHLEMMYGQNWTFAEDMFNTFLNEIVPSFYKLADFVETQNWDGYFKVVHRVQPGLQMVGLSQLKQKVNAVETMVKTAPDKEELLVHTAEIMTDLERYVVILQKQVQSFREKMIQQ